MKPIKITRAKKETTAKERFGFFTDPELRRLESRMQLVDRLLVLQMARDSKGDRASSQLLQQINDLEDLLGFNNPMRLR